MAILEEITAEDRYREFNGAKSFHLIVNQWMLCLFDQGSIQLRRNDILQEMWW